MAKTPGKKTPTVDRARSREDPPELKAAIGSSLTEFIGESFLNDLISDWQGNGAAVIEECRKTKPEAYLRLVATYAPKEFRKQFSPKEEMSDDKLEQELQTLLAELQDLGAKTSPRPRKRASKKAP